MNLQQIRERVAAELQHDPTTTSFRNAVYQLGSDLYQELMASERWHFRTVEHSLRLRKDETGVSVRLNSTTGYPVDLRLAGVTRDVRYHDMDALLLRANDTGDSLRRFGRISGHQGMSVYWRQVMRLYDGYRLSGWPDPDLTPTLDADVFLEQPAATAYLGAGAAFTDGILRHDRYQLPHDCAEIIGFVSRDDRRGEFGLVNRTREKSLMLNDMDTEGQPEAWLLDDPVDAGPAPAKTLAGTVTNGGFSLAAGTYRYFYVHAGKGCLTGPSNIVEVTTTGSSKVDFTNVETEPQDRYWRQKFWFREDNGSGRFRYLTTTGSGLATLTDNGATYTPDENFIWDDRMATPRKTVRFWPRPSADQWVSVQYLRMPRRLVNPQDVPEFPEEYHRILVHRMVEQLAARYDQMRLVSFHRAQAEELLNLMRTKELHRYTTDRLGSYSPGGERASQLRTRPASMS